MAVAPDTESEPTSSTHPLIAGHRYELDDGRIGIISYKGLTAFAPGQWVGLTLERGEGNNDGSVYKKRYFTCRDGRGVFVRPTKIVTYLGSAKRAIPQNNDDDDTQQQQQTNDDVKREEEQPSSSSATVDHAGTLEIMPPGGVRNANYKEVRSNSYVESLENADMHVVGLEELINSLTSPDALIDAKIEIPQNDDDEDGEHNPSNSNNSNAREEERDVSADTPIVLAELHSETESTATGVLVEPEPDHGPFLVDKTMTNEHILNANAGQTVTPKPGPVEIGRNDDFQEPEWEEVQGEFSPKKQREKAPRKLGPRDIGRNDFHSPKYEIPDSVDFLQERGNRR